MSGPASWNTSNESASEGREPGARRKKFAGYLRAANELRQTYQQSYKQAWNNRDAGSDFLDGMPGGFPGAAVTRRDDEELVIFPSYARRHNATKVYILLPVDRSCPVCTLLNASKIARLAAEINPTSEKLTKRA